MNGIKQLASVFLLGITATGSALAHGGPHVHFGIAIGPYWGPRYYPPPYMYYPPYYPPVIVTQPAPAPVYVEQQPAPQTQVQPQQTGYWYYCEASRTYYPYVKECPSGWQQVSPQPSR